MMKTLLLVVLVSFAVADNKLEEEWSAWKGKYGKSYLTNETESWRRAIWSRNYAMVTKHNQAGYSYTLEMNEFADLTAQEFSSIYNGYRRSLPANNTRYWRSPPESLIGIPDKVDWRDKGYVTPVKNQKKCGSCWAFSATGSLEGQHFKKTGKLVSLSEQNLVDCVKGEGCEGGLMTSAFEYIKKNGGIDTEESYPYKAKNEKCHFKESDIGATLRSYEKIIREDCLSLRERVANVGPISAAMDASHNSFQLYKKGIYSPSVCSKTKLDHGILVVGYGNEDGTDYFLVKNSWGTSWGMEGYFMIENKNDLCGICTSASYPVV